MASKISVIIPCYNDGAYVSRAINSIARCESLYEIEIILVNDGSDDLHTLQVISELPKHIKIITQLNKGLSAARNKGIEKASSEYILPLDCDNEILPTYIDKGIGILERNLDVGVVYSDVVLFGDKSEHKVVGDFSFGKMLTGNYIDACAVFRKKTWEDVNGYDEEIKIGSEDWDFWLKIAAKGWQFSYIKEPLFKYMVRGNSLNSKANEVKNNKWLLNYVLSKHTRALRDELKDSINEVNYFNDNPVRYFIKKIFNKKYNLSFFNEKRKRN